MTPPIGIGTLLLPSSFRRSAMGACKAQHLLDGFSSRGQAVSSGGDAALRHDLGSPIGRRRGEAVKCLRYCLLCPRSGNWQINLIFDPFGP
jgi:hypothetical protein